MNIVFLGCTQFSFEILKHLIANGFKPRLVFTIPEYFSISYSQNKIKNYNYANLIEYCEKHEIKAIYIDSGKNQKLTHFHNEIKDVNPDLILVMGWYYMVPKPIRDIAKFGAWGIHASLLPKYAGGAPLVWAIINGEETTGVTLFKLSDGVDDGDIILQKSFKIEFSDTINEVYKKAIKASKQILLKALRNPEKITFTPQDKSSIEIYPQRNPDDGEIDLNARGIDIYNFIRAQSSPYPGAFIRTKDGYKLVIEKVRLQKP